MMDVNGRLTLEDAVRIRAAEVWLEVGQPFRALRELRGVSQDAWAELWTSQVFHAICERLVWHSEQDPLRGERLDLFAQEASSSAADDHACTQRPEPNRVMQFRRLAMQRATFRWAAEGLRTIGDAE